MDTVYSINKLRASFVKASSEVANIRILSPYKMEEVQNDEVLLSKINQLYYDEDTSVNYLERFKSPPIDENYFVEVVHDDYINNSNINTARENLESFKDTQSIDEAQRSLHNIIDPTDSHILENEKMNQNVSLLSAGSSKFHSRRSSNTSIQAFQTYGNETSRKNSESSIPAQRQGSRNFSSASIDSHGSIVAGNKTKFSEKRGRLKSKLSKIRLSRIFKHDNRNGSNTPTEKQIDEAYNSSFSMSRLDSRSSSLQNSDGGQLAFYDRADNVYEEDEDEDDDEDEDTYLLDISKADSDNLTANSISTNYKHKSRVRSDSLLKEDHFSGNNTLKLGKSHSDIINQSLRNVFDLDDNRKSSVISLNHSNENKSGKRTNLKATITALNPMSNNNNNSTNTSSLITDNHKSSTKAHESDEHQVSFSLKNNNEVCSYGNNKHMFDIDSFVNDDDDLGKLDLDNVNTHIQNHKMYEEINEDDRSSFSSFRSVHHNKNMFKKQSQMEVKTGDGDYQNDSFSGDLASSYGHSLIDSDGYEFLSDESESKEPNAVASHTPPRSKDLYNNKMMVDKFGSISTYQGKYLLDSGSELAENKRVISTDTDYSLKKIESSNSLSRPEIQHRNSNKSSLGIGLRALEETNKGSFISFDKTTFNSKQGEVSGLSKLFKVNDDDDALKLSHFKYVSGEHVQSNESVSLLVYIQDYEKYKHDGFKLKVRKNSTIYEVINYILYYFNDLERVLSNENAYENPHEFFLRIVDEDGEPFEDNFGILDRNSKIGSIFDEEVVLCRITDKNEIQNNEKNAPDFGFKKITDEKKPSDPVDSSVHQMSYYKSLTKDVSNKASYPNSEIDIKVYRYPFVESVMINNTTVTVLLISKINDILTKYCKLKNLDPNEYYIKKFKENFYFDLNDNIISLDGQTEVEIISRKEGRTLGLMKYHAYNSQNKSVLPTIQSSEVAPLTLAADGDFLPVGDLTRKGVTSHVTNGTQSELKMNMPTTNKNNNFLYKIKNTSKNSVQNYATSIGAASGASSSFGGGGGSNDAKQFNSFLFTPPSYAQNKNFLLTDAYFKYTVYRRQQVTLINNKHERTLAIDGEYVYITPPEDQQHWYEHHNIKTKSFHISRILLIKKSKKSNLYFKVIVEKQQNPKTYYFEALTAEECNEIVQKLQALVTAYKMNH